MSPILNIGSYLPSSAQAVLRVAVPIAIDYIVSRYLRSPYAAMIPACITLTLATKNVSTFEKVADSALYVTYKVLYMYFSSKVERKKENFRMFQTDEPRRAPDPSPLPTPPVQKKPSSPLEVLQEQFDKISPSLTFTVDSPGQIYASMIERAHSFEEGRIHIINQMFELAKTDLDNLYEELLQETKNLSELEQPRAMAQLLTDKNHSKRYFERFCDSSKPTLLFLYRIVRGYIYFTRISGKIQSHAFDLDRDHRLQFFTERTQQHQWRDMYNSMILKWSKVLEHLSPDSETAKWAVTDDSVFPAPDDFDVKGFKINHQKILIGI